MDKILKLWLPPTFSEVEENTLGSILQQDTLTWEALVVSLSSQEPPAEVSGSLAHFHRKPAGTVLLPQPNAFPGQFPHATSSTQFTLLPSCDL